MTRIGLSVTTQSPLLLSESPPAHNLSETLEFIPGNSIRGVLAQQYLDQGGKPEDDLFESLFLSGVTKYGFGFVNGSQPIPLSARSCKYDPGFENEGHGVIDLLLSHQEDNVCPICKKTVDYFTGFWDSGSKKQCEVHKRLITRTAIDPLRGSASSGQLYSQRVIEEGQTFHSTIETESELSSALDKLIEPSLLGGIGRGRSRGQGWVRIKKKDPPSHSWGPAEERFHRFQNEASSTLLVVTLLTDAVFQDEYLRDCTAPRIFHLGPLEINPDEWEPVPVRAFASHRLVFGFDGIPFQLPRIPRVAVEKGSVFCFRPKNGIKPSIPGGEGTGWIGENNREGFGQAVLWHPFHLDHGKGI